MPCHAVRYHAVFLVSKYSNALFSVIRAASWLNIPIERYANDESTSSHELSRF